MTPRISVVIPAYREEARVGQTVRAIAGALAGREAEILVVDDGSDDGTAATAAAAGARVLHLERNCGKGEAVRRGLDEAEGDVLLLLDADLEETAGQAVALLEPVLHGDADLCVAAFPPPQKTGGFGLVQRLARGAVRRAGGEMMSPLSGQRALTRDAWRRIGRLDDGFALEMGMDLDALQMGLRVMEVALSMRHRETGRDLAGFLHRARQYLDVLRAIRRRRRRR